MEPQLASDADILKSIEEFCAKREMGVSTFGRLAVGDPSLVGGIKNGRSLTLRTAEKVVSFMSSYEPTQPAEKAA